MKNKEINEIKGILKEANTIDNPTLILKNMEKVIYLYNDRLLKHLKHKYDLKLIKENFEEILKNFNEILN